MEKLSDEAWEDLVFTEKKGKLLMPIAEQTFIIPHSFDYCPSLL